MTALAQLLDGDQAARLARLRLDLATAPAQARPASVVCPACGQTRPVPAAVFRPPGTA